MARWYAYCITHTLSSAFAGVELCHCAINVQEHCLRNVLCFTGVTNNFQRNAQHQLLVAVEENREGVALPLLEAGHELLVRQTLQLRRRQRFGKPKAWIERIQDCARFGSRKRGNG